MCVIPVITVCNYFDYDVTLDNNLISSVKHY